MTRKIKALLLVVLALMVVFTFAACGHQHTYSEEWTSNATHHWQDATCNHDEKRYEGEHQFGAGEPNAAGTELVYTCRICKYTKTEPIPVHQHVYEG
ncbi:MAG: hypothetical protein IKC47_03935, partial [Clostridia bacterium]|nr:hypothetical protein [Clostridia bacterium]